MKVRIRICICESLKIFIYEILKDSSDSNCSHIYSWVVFTYIFLNRFCLDCEIWQLHVQPKVMAVLFCFYHYNFEQLLCVVIISADSMRIFSQIPNIAFYIQMSVLYIPLHTNIYIYFTFIYVYIYFINNLEQDCPSQDRPTFMNIPLIFWAFTSICSILLEDIREIFGFDYKTHDVLC